jgi:hypothetical protein
MTVLERRDRDDLMAAQAADDQAHRDLSAAKAAGSPADVIASEQAKVDQSDRDLARAQDEYTRSSDSLVKLRAIVGHRCENR